MPWHVGTSSQCPASKPHAVIKDSDGSVVGCHATKEKANKQLAALNANEGTMSQSTETNSRPPRDNLFRAVYPGVEFRSDENGDGPVLFGHFARFNEWTEIDSWIEGRFMERFAPGAFKKTLREQKPKVLFQHGRDSQLGDKPLGDLREVREDDEGAYYEVDLFDGIPDLVMDGLRAGAYGASFRFSVVREDRNEKPGASEHNPEGIPERTVKEAQVREFGPVTFPAYEGATAGVRSLTDEFLIQNLASNPERLRRLLDWLDADQQMRNNDDESHDAGPDGQEAEDHLEREQDQEDTAPPEETPEPRSTSPQGRRETSTGLVLPRAPKPRRAGVLPDRDEGEQGWTPIRLP